MLNPAMTASDFSWRCGSPAKHKMPPLSPTDTTRTLGAGGLTNRQTAVKLYLGEGIVLNYVSSVLAKIGAVNRAEAAPFAVKNNIKELVPPTNKLKDD
jgi:DNA-binding CsgD family transcriptional regulator